MKGRKIFSFLLGVIVVLVFAGKYANTQEQSGITFNNVPYDTIQLAIDAAELAGGGLIEVAAGTYSPSTNGESFPLKIPATTNGIQLIGAGADNCILEAQVGLRVIRFDGGDYKTIVEGFTIRHRSGSAGGGILCKVGTSPIITNNIITGNNSGGSGGGISCINSSPTITDNTITGNHTDSRGGGISCSGNYSPIIIDNDITGNTATLGGGGISCESYSSPTINNNIITGNNANINEDNWMLGGGGILCSGFSSPTITNNLISENSVSDNYFIAKGGGIKCAQFSDATIINNIITNNSASSSKGGGISSESSSPVIINNTIDNNTAYSNGGGIAFEGSHTSDSTITNNIITGNDSGGPGGGIYCHPSSPDITYNNVYNNNNVNNNTISNYSDPSMEGVGCFSLDPLFVAPDSGNYHLQSDSPCIDVGNNDALEIPYPHIGFDFEGNWRFIDSNTGNSGTIDMGAYEFFPQANNLPVAVDDSYSVSEDEILSVLPTTEINGVLKNDSDDDGDTLTAVPADPVSHGTLELNPDGSFTYEPDDDFNGTDTFTYMANDGNADSETAATVTITIDPVNDPPVADDQPTITTDEDTEKIPIILTATDVDEDSLTYSVETGPVNGTLSGTPPDLTYTPVLNYHGVDSLTFKVNDGEYDSNFVTVSITINPKNDPPEANAGPDQTIAASDECEAEVTLNGTGSNDIDGDELTYTWDGPFGQASGVQPTVILGKGTHDIRLTVNDGKDGTATDTVQITVEDQTPPVISLSDSVYVSVWKGKGKGRRKGKWEKVNKLTVSATDNCSSDIALTIDNVEIFNKKGRPPKGKGVYYIIDGNDIYVFPKKKKWSIRVTVTATDESGNSVTDTISKTLLKYKGWSWKSFFKLLFWKCFH